MWNAQSSGVISVKAKPNFPAPACPIAQYNQPSVKAHKIFCVSYSGRQYKDEIGDTAPACTT